MPYPPDKVIWPLNNWGLVSVKKEADFPSDKVFKDVMTEMQGNGREIAIKNCFPYATHVETLPYASIH